MGKNELDPIYKEPRQADVLHSLPDTTNIRKFLGFVPAYDIDLGLNKTIEWYKKSLSDKNRI